MKYKTQGVCSREISFEVENNKLKNVKFVGGCAGNTRAWPVWWRAWISTM